MYRPHGFNKFNLCHISFKNFWRHKIWQFKQKLLHVLSLIWYQSPHHQCPQGDNAILNSTSIITMSASTNPRLNLIDMLIVSFFLNYKNGHFTWLNLIASFCVFLNFMSKNFKNVHTILRVAFCLQDRFGDLSMLTHNSSWFYLL